VSGLRQPRRLLYPLAAFATYTYLAVQPVQCPHSYRFQILRSHSQPLVDARVQSTSHGYDYSMLRRPVLDIFQPGSVVKPVGFENSPRWRLGRRPLQLHQVSQRAQIEVQLFSLQIEGHLALFHAGRELDEGVAQPFDFFFGQRIALDAVQSLPL